MSIKVSVIIPVYNAEKHIAQCIESLVGQTLHECEFIFINDGSKDKSQYIIEKYQNIDNRIKLINQKNQGASLARNEGIRKASGEYIGFVDADDFIEKEMYEKLYFSAIKGNCDIVICNFENEIDGHKIITKYPFPSDTVLRKEFLEEEILPYLLKKDNLNAVWNKIYKNRVITLNEIKFPEKISLGEDGIFNIRFFSNANSMKYIDYTGYHYREVEGSVTRNITKRDYFARAIEIYNLDLPEFKKWSMDKDKIRNLKSIRLINSVMSYIHLYFAPSKDLSIRNRYKYVKNMVSHKIIKNALPFYYIETYVSLGRYERLLINMIRQKSVLGLFCITLYSRFRNK